VVTVVKVKESARKAGAVAAEAAKEKGKEAVRDRLDEDDQDDDPTGDDPAEDQDGGDWVMWVVGAFVLWRLYDLMNDTQEIIDGV
jgi:hypothetical protein